MRSVVGAGGVQEKESEATSMNSAEKQPRTRFTFMVFIAIIEGGLMSILENNL